MSLATKYRPATFEDVCGQNITVDLLKKAIEQNKFSNAILLAGASGCGKTTLARIFANKINKGIGDPIEINASDKNSVDDVRLILESANQRALAGEYKVIIIDECHMLGGGNKNGNSAWSAFLKGIEECPKYTIFMFCTTDPQRIPDTILNRVQRYNVLPIGSKLIKQRLEYICKQEGFTNYEKTCELISKTCHGGMRDAIAILEQCSDLSADLSLDNVKQILGESSFETMFKLTWAIQQKDEKTVLFILDSLHNSGNDLKNFISLYLDFVLDIQKYILFNDINATNIPSYLASETNPVVQFTVKDANSLDYFGRLSNTILDIKCFTKWDTSNAKSTIEIILLKFCRGE